MTSFEIDGRQYRVRPFEADTHVSLMLRLSPLFAALAAAAPDLLAARQRHGASETPNALDLLSDLAKASEGAADKLASLDRTGDAKGIISACLQAADQIVDGQAYPVMTKAGSISNMKDNGDYLSKLRITVEVVRANFKPTLMGLGIDVESLMGGAPDGGV